MAKIYGTSKWAEEGSFKDDILHSYQDIVDAIRNAPWAVDTREAMAQMLIFLYSTVQSMGDGFGVDMSPTDAFKNLAELKARYPNGQQGVFVTQDDGRWWFWSELENVWKDGGFYQASAPIDDIRAVDAKATSNANLLKSLLADFTKEVTDRKKIDADLIDKVASYLTALELKEVRLRDEQNGLLWDGNNYVTGNVYLPKTDRTGLEEGVPVDSSVIGYTFLGHLEEYELPILKLESPDLLSLRTKGDGKLSNVKFEYIPNGGPGKYLQGTLDSIKVQGSGSQRYVKKNYTIKFTEDIQFKPEWGKHGKYVIKADWVDFSHMRNEFGASLWGDIRKTRIETNDNVLVDNNGNEFVRTEISNLTGEIRQQFAMGMNMGAIDSYPIFVIINGVYHGLYSFTVPKDDWMAGMGQGEKEAIVSSTQALSTRFKAPVEVDSSGNLHDRGFGLEYVSDEKKQDWVPQSLNKLINAIQSNTGVDQHLDIDSAIDYLIMNLLDANQDAVDRNWLMDTWDGIRWTFVAYDMDSAFGNYWDGAHYDSPSAYDLNYHTNISNLYKWIVENRKEDLLDRWDYLRKGELSDNTLLNKVYNFAIKTPEEAFAYERKRWPGRPGTRTNNYQQIVTWLLMRTKFLDKMFDKIR